MWAKFIPSMPAIIVGTAAMATQAEIFHVLVLRDGEPREAGLQDRGQELVEALHLVAHPGEVVLDVPEVLPDVGVREGRGRSESSRSGPASGPTVRFISMTSRLSW